MRRFFSISSSRDAGARRTRSDAPARCRRDALVTALVLLSALSLAACRPVAPARDAVQEAFREGGLTAHEAHGYSVFARRCASCHGPEGRGDGQNAYNLDPAPPDFRDSLRRMSASDRRRVVVGGTRALQRSALCPPAGATLSPEELEAVLAWLDAVARGAADAKPSETP